MVKVFEMIKKTPIRVKLSITFLVLLCSFLTFLDPIGFGITMLILVVITFSAAAVISIVSWIVDIIEDC